jgi:hypothetical protein
VATGGVAKAVNPFLRIAAAPLAEVFLVPLSLPFAKPIGRLGLEALRLTGTDLGRDHDQIARVLDALPDRDARIAFTRTLRSGVDWRGQVVTLRDRCYLAEAMPTLIVWGTRAASSLSPMPTRRTRRCPAASSLRGRRHFPTTTTPTASSSWSRLQPPPALPTTTPHGGPARGRPPSTTPGDDPLPRLDLAPSGTGSPGRSRPPEVGAEVPSVLVARAA